MGFSGATTYETLWSNKSRLDDKCNPDAWLRDLISNLDMAYLLALFGREELKWQECGFNGEIEQKELKGLSNNEADEYLKQSNVKEPEIREQIIKNADGLPLFLYLEAQTYKRLQNPTVADFEKSEKREILERFIEHLHENERDLIKLLAHPISFDTNLIEVLLKEFLNLGYLDYMDSFLSLSFFTKEENSYRMHSLVREHVLTFQDKNYFTKVEEFLFSYYESFFKDLELKDFKN